MLYPALDVTTDGSAILDALLLVIDDHRPTAIHDDDEHDGRLTIFFSDAVSRDRAAAAIVREWPRAVVASREVDDEDWARRSQENLAPVTIGRVIIAPPWAKASARPVQPDPPVPSVLPDLPVPPVLVIIQPSMGFGTGHHATTRLCVTALQNAPLAGATLLDVGTGSGVLAIAARRLGAARAIGIDHDADAVRSADENLVLNPDADNVRFELADLKEWLDRRRSTADTIGTAIDVITANLTGSLLERSAALLISAIRPGGWLILSGLTTMERNVVVAAFSDAQLVDELTEDGWTELTLKRL